LLPSDTQHGSTGDEGFEVETARQQLCHLHGGARHLLKVVQHQQQVLLPQKRFYEVEQRVTSRLVDVEGLGNGGEDQSRIVERGKVHEIHAVGIVGKQVVGNREPQACLADPASADKGQQAHFWTS
jgi:hypothetical protein